MKALQFLLASGLVLAGAANSYAAAFTNGSFEGSGFVNTDPLKPGFMTLPANSTIIPGWTVVTSVDWLSTWITPEDGTKSVDLNASNIGAIQQTFDTNPGQTYLVDFALAGNVSDPPSLKTGFVSAAGQSMSYQFNDSGDSAASPGWVDEDFFFTANSTSSTLLFQSTTNNTAGGPVIDNVRVSAVPEPTSLALLSIGGLLTLRRPKSRA